MERIKYPILYYELKNDFILGLLVGTDYQLVEKDLRSLKSNLSRYLQKQYKKYEDYPFVNLVDARLKMMMVNIRPTYKEEGASYPLADTVSVPIPLVYGDTDEGHYECYLPLLEESFYYYDPKQFENLARHFATNVLNTKKPADLYKMLSYKYPSLDFVTLKIHSEKDGDWNKWNFERDFAVLDRLAEKYPQPKAIQRNNSVLPEAAWELEAEVLEVMEKMIQQRANVLVVGKHGVGKSAVLRQAIKKISTRSKKKKLEYTFWRILSQRITASAKYLGEWEESVEWLIEELTAANGILWVVDVIRLLQSGGSSPEASIAAFLLPFMQQGKLQIVGEVTPQELESMRRLLPGFTENFQIVTIEELSAKKVEAIFEKVAEFAKQNLKIEISENNLSLVYRLLARFNPYEKFPGKGIRFLGECINEAQLNNEQVIDRQAIISHFIKKFGLPELFLRDDLLLDQKELQQFFNTKIIGQEKAVEKMCGIVKIYKAGLNNPRKPITTLLFAGPTGVGKTASAKTLANYFFGKGQLRDPLIRIDMSEFQYPGQIYRFIGTGKEPGQLIKEIRERPFSVLLLDEIEKANPAIFDALLTVLDEGLLLDAFGRETNFRNSIIILTTNLGASNRKSIGFTQLEDEESAYLAAISKFFRPEFVNRIDGIVMFNSLTSENIKKIAEKELEELKSREGFQKRNLKIEFTKSLILHLAKTGFDEKFGARPLQRTLEDEVVKPLAAWLLEHPTLMDCKILVDFDEKIRINKTK